MMKKEDLYIRGISVRGKYEHLTKSEVKTLCAFFGQWFLGKRLWKNIYLEVQFMSIQEYGLCSPTDFDSRRPRDFEILLSNSLTRTDQIGTLIHELCHLKQFAKGELSQYYRGEYKWLGKKCSFEDEDYFIMPWEIEARLYEDVFLPYGEKLVCRT